MSPFGRAGQALSRRARAGGEPEPMWNDALEEREPRCRDVEEQVEMHRRSKTLVDCTLPDGFRLATPRPTQYWMGSQVVWGFCLVWRRLDSHGNPCGDEYCYIARYHQSVGDDVQMQWALDEFMRELRAAGLDERAPKVWLQTTVRMRPDIIPQRQWHKAHLRFAS